jgi:citrate synthase
MTQETAALFALARSVGKLADAIQRHTDAQGIGSPAEQLLDEDELPQ